MTGNGVTPVFVFDASKEADTGAKAEENKRRAETRATAKKSALGLLRAGDRVGAGKQAVKAVTITDALVYRIIQHFDPARHRYVRVLLVDAASFVDAAFLINSGYSLQLAPCSVRVLPRV